MMMMIGQTKIMKSRIVEPGNLEILNLFFLMNSTKIKIRVAKNVGKVWISRKHTFCTSFINFRLICPWAEKMLKVTFFLNFPWAANGQA